MGYQEVIIFLLLLLLFEGTVLTCLQNQMNRENKLLEESLRELKDLPNYPT